MKIGDKNMTKLEHGIRLKGTSREEKAQEIEGLIGTEVMCGFGEITVRVRIVRIETKYGIPRAQIKPVSGGPDTIWVYLSRLTMP